MITDVDLITFFAFAFFISSADSNKESLKMLLLLAYELGYFRCKNEIKNIRSTSDAERKFLFVSESIKEIGKMLGGWIKKVYGEKNNDINIEKN